jgi:tRNA A-37 threonylcarbamoyl transferase component Bud32
VLQPGSVFANDYEIVAPLAEGGMGAVYTARQRSTGKMRALKVMLPEIVADPDHRRRFEQEARIGSRIASEHVVEVIEAGIDGATPYLVMELLRGVDLKKHLERRGALPRSEVRAIFAQLCHAVGAAHRAGIVHRDLKPENVFLAETQRADVAFEIKVLDFGIAKMAAEAGKQNTRAVGSPLWMSPEQTQRGPVTPAADVWALGLIAFQLLTGIHFWRCTDEPEPAITTLLQNVLVEPIPSATARAASRGIATIPAGFDEVFAGCVVRDPSVRFQDATAFWIALEPVLQEIRVATAIPVRVAPRRSRLVPILLAAFILPIVLAGAAFAILMRRPIAAPLPSAAPIQVLPPAATPVHGSATMRGLQGYGEHIEPHDLVRTFDHNIDRYQRCYETSLAKQPTLRGGVTLKIVIGRDGEAKLVTSELPPPEVIERVPPMPDLPSPEAIACMVDETKHIGFPTPDNGAATYWLFLTLEPQ